MFHGPPEITCFWTTLICLFFLLVLLLCRVYFTFHISSTIILAHSIIVIIVIYIYIYIYTYCCIWSSFFACQTQEKLFLSEHKNANFSFLQY
jgi:hypothetical protein